MTKYLLSTYSSPPAEAPDATAPPAAAPDPEQMQKMMKTIMDLEAEMDEAGAFVFGGRLHDPDAATVVDGRGSSPVMTDGPFAEAHEHIAGFYLIEAPDLDAALGWASRVSNCVGQPIEVWPFAASGRVADHFPG